MLFLFRLRDRFKENLAAARGASLCLRRMTPPPLPPASKVARSAVWSLVLAGVAWLGLIGLLALGIHDKPAADNRTASLVVLAVGVGMAGTLASLVLAIR